MGKSCVPQDLDKCCFYFSLKTGVKLIAYIQIVYLSVLLIIFTIYLSPLETPSSTHHETDIMVNIFIEVGRLIYMAFLCVYGFYIIITILLFIGVYANKSGFLMAWLIFTFAGIVLNLIFIIFIFLGAGEIHLIIVLSILNLVVSIYFWIVVLKLWKRIKMEQEQSAEQQFNMNTAV